jgi:hypothetical protein
VSIVDFHENTGGIVDAIGRHAQCVCSPCGFEFGMAWFAFQKINHTHPDPFDLLALNFDRNIKYKTASSHKTKLTIKNIATLSI